MKRLSIILLIMIAAFCIAVPTVIGEEYIYFPLIENCAILWPTYAGSTEAPDVVYRNELLEEGVDYSIELSADKQTYTITGLGRFSGTRTVDVHNFATSFSTPTTNLGKYEYTGSPIIPNNVYKDYTVQVWDNVAYGEEASMRVIANGENNTYGSAVVSFGIGGLTGSMNFQNGTPAACRMEPGYDLYIYASILHDCYIYKNGTTYYSSSAPSSTTQSSSSGSNHIDTTGWPEGTYDVVITNYNYTWVVRNVRDEFGNISPQYVYDRTSVSSIQKSSLILAEKVKKHIYPTSLTADVPAPCGFEKIYLNVLPSPLNAILPSEDIVWSTSDADTASVSGHGIVILKKAGQAVITAAYKDMTCSWELDIAPLDFSDAVLIGYSPDADTAAILYKGQLLKQGTHFTIDTMTTRESVKQITATGIGLFEGTISGGYWYTDTGYPLCPDEDPYNAQSFVKSFEFNGRELIAYNGTHEVINVPVGTETIAAGVFNGNTTAHEVIVPEGVTRIGDGAFENCTALSSITLPQSLAYIDNYVLEGCTYLDYIELPDNIDTILYGKDLASSTTFGDAVPVCTKGSRTERALAAHDYGYAFYTGAPYTVQLKSDGTYKLMFPAPSYSGEITITEDISEIANNAFFDCKNITAIYFSDISDLKIGINAFTYCPAVLYADMHSGVASKLNSFVDPDYPDFLMSYSTTSGQTVLTATNRYDTLENEELTSLVIPEGVNNIDLSDMTCLEKVTLPSTVTEVGNNTFDGCTALKEVILHNGITAIGSQAFYNCSSLENLELPESIISIGREAFSGCASLESIAIPEKIESLAYAFYGYYGTIYMPDNLDNLDTLSNLELGCTYICNIGSSTSLKLNAAGKSFVSPDYPYFSLSYVSTSEPYTLKISMCDETVTEVSLPENVVAIGDYAFRYSALKSIVIPESVTTIGNYAFYKCEDLTSVVFSDNDADQNGVGYIGESAFSCTALQSVKIPGRFGRIGAGAFDFCTRLTSAAISEGVTSIGDKAFYQCRSLQYITIPSSVTSIGTDAFDPIQMYYWMHIMFLGHGPIAFADGDIFGYADVKIYCYKNSDVDIWVTENKKSDWYINYIDDIDLTDLMYFSLPNYIGPVVEGDKFTVDPIFFPSGIEEQVNWSISDTSIVTMENGVFSAQAAGKATITATCGSFSATRTVNVYSDIKSFDFSPSEIWLSYYDEQELRICNLQPADGMTTFDWKSSETGVARVQSGYSVDELRGRVSSANTPGDVVITATSFNGVTAQCIVHVCYPVSSVEFKESALTIPEDSSVQLTANVTTHNGAKLVNKLVSFASSDESIVSVTADGVVTAHGVGSVTITATAASGVSASCSVYVLSGKELALPVALTVIDDEAFMGAGLEKVVIPSGCTTIGAKAFADNASLVVVIMPDSVTSIADDAFEGCGNVIFVCESENTAYDFAAEHNIANIIR